MVEDAARKLIGSVRGAMARQEVYGKKARQVAVGARIRNGIRVSLQMS